MYKSGIFRQWSTAYSSCAFSFGQRNEQLYQLTISFGIALIIRNRDVLISRFNSIIMAGVNLNEKTLKHRQLISTITKPG
jgi:hypothetical protein